MWLAFGDGSVHLLTHDHDDSNYQVDWRPVSDSWYILGQNHRPTQGPAEEYIVFAEVLKFAAMAAQASRIVERAWPTTQSDTWCCTWSQDL